MRPNDEECEKSTQLPNEPLEMVLRKFDSSLIKVIESFGLLPA